MKLFDGLEDETPPTIGQEFGAALGIAVAEIGKESALATERISTMLTHAISEAISRVESKQINIQNSAVKKWDFQVERGKDGLIKRITAEAQE